MKEKNIGGIVPPQHEGTKKDIEHIVTTQDVNDARKLFDVARKRLMDVNHWQEWSGQPTSTFRLTDEKGNEINRTAEEGDYFKIDLPGPGTVEGEGYDWVFVEAIDELRDPDGNKEFIAMRVRPSSHPGKKGENVAHFFKEDSTSSFVVMREGTEVKAAVFGRNEILNTATSRVIDKVRNAVVGVTAILGFSNVQWGNLVRGLLHT